LERLQQVLRSALEHQCLPLYGLRARDLAGGGGGAIGLQILTPEGVLPEYFDCPSDAPHLVAIGATRHAYTGLPFSQPAHTPSHAGQSPQPESGRYGTGASDGSQRANASDHPTPQGRCRLDDLVRLRRRHGQLLAPPGAQCLIDRRRRRHIGAMRNLICLVLHEAFGQAEYPLSCIVQRWQQRA
jgi:hypothetical protein